MTKIEALQKTIYNLENDVYEYNWMAFDSCNCGILARTIMDGKKPSEAGSHSIDEHIGIASGFSGTYGGAVSYCAATGIPLPEVFMELTKIGFSVDEIDGLEILSNRMVLDRMGVVGRWCSYEDKKNVISYLKAWVEILQEQQQPQYLDLTQSLAVLPIEETSDVVKQNIEQWQGYTN